MKGAATASLTRPACRLPEQEHDTGLCKTAIPMVPENQIDGSNGCSKTELSAFTVLNTSAALLRGVNKSIKSH